MPEANDVVAGFQIAAHALGFFRVDSLYTSAQVASIIKFWTALKNHARLVVPSYGNMADLFVAGEIVAATPGWSAVNSFAAAKGDHKVEHTVPAEGAASFCDAYMIPQGAPDTDAAYAFINEAFTPEAQAQEANYLVQGAVNPKAVPLMSAATRGLYPYDQIERVLTAKAPLVAIPVKVPSGYASFTDWNTAWEAFKA
jgi:spermidine/putrescine transport system substrate-binding protein